MHKKIFRLCFGASAFLLTVCMAAMLFVFTNCFAYTNLIQRLIVPLVIVWVLILGLALVFCKKIANLVVTPINTLNPDKPADIYEELNPLLDKISAQSITINQQLKESNQKQGEFMLITENMSEGFIVIDKHKNLLTFNSAALRLLDIDDAERGTGVLELNRTSAFQSVINRSLGGKRSEEELNRDDFCYRLIANPVFEEDEVIGAVVVILDVTESSRREQLRREFTSNVSHELKTPLTSISGFAEIMKDGTTDPHTVADFSASIYDEAQRLISLVTDIIKISELDEDSGHFVREDVDLYALAKDVISYLMPAAVKRGITVELEGESCFVYGTYKILEEMISNLYDNAIKYNKENGRIKVKVYSENGKAVVSVSDTGIGIPFADRARVFERFYRVDKSHSRSLGGTGLGLSIVKHGALFHNADISLESVEFKGTTITVTFDDSQS